jgi:hypothetical protein
MLLLGAGVGPTYASYVPGITSMSHCDPGGCGPAGGLIDSL